MTTKTTILGVLALLLGACGDDAGTGTVRVTMSGEEAAEIGYPAGDIAFVDGWTVEVEHVMVSIVGFALRNADGDEVALTVDPVVADLHESVPTLWTFEGVPAARWDRVSYQFGAPTAASRRVGAVDEDVVSAMTSANAAIYLQAVASEGGRDVRFAFPFDLDVDATHCVAADGTEGLVVREGSIDDAQITIHLDHLFFDSFAIEEPALRFDPMAAVAGDDGELTFDELATQSIADVRDAEGGPIFREDGTTPLVYDPGDLVLDAPNLRDYVRAAATTMGHFQGEGHCQYARR